MAKNKDKTDELSLESVLCSCTRLIKNVGVWDWQKLSSKCLLKN